MNVALNDASYTQTRFFQACRGVFEGGGARGAAHVGAYQAAIQGGVHFSEVAGTSAGSIVAALIGAGASPDYLLKTVAHLKFSELLSEPDRRIATPWIVRLAGFFLHGKYGLLGKIARNGSAHSSEKIQVTVDNWLAELLPEADRPIKFKDLPLPTWIVATDLSGRRAKVWSSKDTPDESVALAVRCSCSIPLFFEPVEAGVDLYVDGGMLSNLPAFVYAQGRQDPQALGGRILGFRLEGEADHSTQRNILWMVKRLIDTAISGSTKIQGELMDNVSTVVIPTGKISSTNFDISNDDVDFLLRSGRSAVSQFLKNEHTKLDDALTSDVARYGDDELFDDLTREMCTPGKRMIVACDDTKWFWSLFPSVAHWAFNNASIDVLIQRSGYDKREKHRQELMKRLGVRITTADELPFRGYILNRIDDRHDAAFISHISHTQYSPSGAVYVGATHRPVIQGMTRLLEQLVGPTPVHSVKLELRRGSDKRLIDLLKRGVNQYADPRVTLSLECVSLRQATKKVRLIVRRIRSYKYRQTEAFISLHERFQIPFGTPADIFANGEYVSTITPPVLEEWGDDLVAIEGNTRIFYLNQAAADYIHAFVVRGVTHPLPGISLDPRRALISTYHLSHQERIEDFTYASFRSIEGAARPEN
jgi:predicted acylesterase/phospholipase RssA